MQIKPEKKTRIIWDGSIKTSPDQIVLNEQTSIEFKAIVDFGTAKMRLLISIYNWRISFPKETIYVALADITACFRFPRMAADLTGAFGFVADAMYYWSPVMCLALILLAAVGSHSDEQFKFSYESTLNKWTLLRNTQNFSLCLNGTTSLELPKVSRQLSHVL